VNVIHHGRSPLSSLPLAPAPDTLHVGMNDTSEHNGGEVVLYESPDGEVRLDVRLERESIWPTQKQMADLFDTSTDNIGLHLKNVYGEGELAEEATTEDSSVVRLEGSRRVRRTVKHYSLDAIISVGYRVDAARGTVAIRLQSVISSSSHRRALDSYTYTC